MWVGRIDDSSYLHLVGYERWFDMTGRLLGDLLVDLNHVLVAQLLRKTALHWAELAGTAPDHGVAKLEQQVFMDLQDGRLHGESLPSKCQEKRVREVGSLASSLRVDAHQ